MTDIEKRRANWRAYYYRTRETRLQKAKEYAANRVETPEQRTHRLTTVKAWFTAHPGYQAPGSTPESRKAWREAAKAKDPEKWRRSERAVRLKSKYGITIDAYEAMLAAQGNVCAICKQPETMTIKGTLCMLAVDHDHASGAVRGLLCTKCNMLIGGANHDRSILQAAMDYLS